MKIIPAIDIIDGKCVRLTKGDYATKKVYNENPVEVALEFEANGIQFLHLVDLDGAKSKRIVNYKVLERIANETNLTIDFGGGIKSDDDIRIAFESGAKQITVGSVAVSEPALFKSWLDEFGSDKIILGADCKNRKIATDGWLKSSNHSVLEFIKTFQNDGVSSVICTDISKDGMLKGPSFDLYNEILTHVDINLIASGGVSKLQDLRDLSDLGCSGAIVGKAIYEGNITLKELQRLC